MSEILPRLSAALADYYRIERELGGGGMSRVFLAEEVALGRKVVVKVLPPDIAAGINVDRFRREIHLAASLQHPHIVPLLAAGSADGLLYYTMPLVEGESLRAKLARERELPINEAIKLLRDVADALACAHEHGVLHRDIKPDNILVSRHHALVADFGVAKALSAASGEASGTTEGVALGTPAYMAPEQAAADPHTDHRADLYALGVVGYEMLTGNTPFPGLSGQAALAAHATKPAPPVTEARPSVPASLATLIMRCLEKHPADRWQSSEEVLQQLEAMTTPSGGTAPTSAMPARRPTRRRRLLPLAGVAVAAMLALVAIVLRRPGAGASLDANLLAVAPFDALGGELELWKEGLVDLLSRNLDGAGPLRTVSPTVVIRRWQGRADPTSASTLGRRTGAGLAVFGNLVASGRDSVRLSATIFDVARDRTIGEVELRGDTRHMDRLADSLTVALLRELARKHDIVAVRTASLRATSLPALKAFLEGERLYRRGSWDSAQAAYRRALGHDSTFVPALRHLGQSLWWVTGEDSYVSYLLRAGELNRGLPRRDSLLAAADSMFAALGGRLNELTPEVRRSLARRLFGTLEDGVRIYPEDPEIWYELGEVRFHLGWTAGVSPAQMLDAFDRSIALDSSFTPAYAHAPGLGAVLHGRQGWDRYAAPYLARRRADDYSSGAPLVNAILNSDPRQPGRIDSMIRASSVEEIFEAMVDAWHFPESSEVGIRLARGLVASRGHATGFLKEPMLRREVLAGVLGFRGHLREAQGVIEGERQPTYMPSLPAELALAGAGQPDSAEAIFGRWLRHSPLWPPGEWPRGGAPGPLMFVLPWWAARRDTLALAHYTRRADSAQRETSRPREREVTKYAAEASRAYTALARGDTVAALRRFEALPDDIWWGALEQVTEGQILARRGRDADALKLFEGAFPINWWGPARVLAALDAARAAERLDQGERATAAYQFVLDAWRHADPELEPYVREARAGLERLVAEPKR